MTLSTSTPPLRPSRPLRLPCRLALNPPIFAELFPIYLYQYFPFWMRRHMLQKSKESIEKVSWLLRLYERLPGGSVCRLVHVCVHVCSSNCFRYRSFSVEAFASRFRGTSDLIFIFSPPSVLRPPLSPEPNSSSLFPAQTLGKKVSISTLVLPSALPLTHMSSRPPSPLPTSAITARGSMTPRASGQLPSPTKLDS